MSRVSSARAKSRHRRQFRTGKIAVALLFLLCHTGCLTPMALEKYLQGRALQAAQLEVIEATPTMVRLAYQITYEGAGGRSGVVEFNPRLSGCDQVHVFIRDASKVPLAPIHETHSQSPEALEEETSDSFPKSPCTVAIVASTSTDSEAFLIKASNATQTLGHSTIDGPRNHAWLVVIQAAAMVDSVTVVPAGVAVAAAYGWSQSLHRAWTWTWTP